MSNSKQVFPVLERERENERKRERGREKQKDRGNKDSWQIFLFPKNRSKGHVQPLSQKPSEPRRTGPEFSSCYQLSCYIVPWPNP
ncbi:hypothetical protein STEG23_021451, partial [Scotinomys teguina]